MESQKLFTLFIMFNFKQIKNKSFLIYINQYKLIKTIQSKQSIKINK